MNFTIKQGMNQDILKTYPDNHFDSIVTDPPYGIEFLNKEWDKNTGAIETWEECFRVLKPGGHILAFSAARTYHNLATNIESVGFEIRDQLMWLYASGFPKAQDIGKAIEKREGKRANAGSGDKWQNAGKGTNTTTCSMCGSTCVQIGIGFNCKEPNCEFIEKLKPADNEWAGWKTALKPAHEPIVMARKPFKGSCIDNVLKHGTGALNIDATRIGDEEMPIGAHDQTGCLFNQNKKSKMADETVQGRYPSNVLGEIPEYQKFFYCPKVSRAERHVGFESVPDRVCGPGGDDWVTAQEHQGNNKKGSLDHIPTSEGGMFDDHGTGKMYNIASGTKQKGTIDHIPTAPGSGSNQMYGEGQGALHKRPVVGNNHPTVKPVALMSYLVKLVTPPGGKVLDPYNGSGSTGMACVEHGFDYTGCELDPNYVEIATKRIEGWYAKTLPDNNFNELFQEEKQV